MSNNVLNRSGAKKIANANAFTLVTPNAINTLQQIANELHSTYTLNSVCNTLQENKAKITSEHLRKGNEIGFNNYNRKI